MTDRSLHTPTGDSKISSFTSRRRRPQAGSPTGASVESSTLIRASARVCADTTADQHGQWSVGYARASPIFHNPLTLCIIPGRPSRNQLGAVWEFFSDSCARRVRAQSDQNDSSTTPFSREGGREKSRRKFPTLSLASLSQNITGRTWGCILICTGAFNTSHINGLRVKRALPNFTANILKT